MNDPSASNEVLDEAQPDVLLQRAIALANENKYAEAVQLLQDLLIRFPQDTRALSQLASILWRLQKFQDASACLGRLLELDANNGHVWNSRAMCLAALGDENQAIDCFKRAVELLPDNEALHQNLASAYERTKRWREAAESCRRVLALNPCSERSLHLLASASSNLKDYQGQLSALDRLSQLRGLTYDERMLRAEALSRIERTDEALLDLDAVLSANPNHAPAYFLRGAILQQQGKHERAIDDLNRAIELDPQMAPAYWYLTQSKKFTAADLPIVKRMEELVEATAADDLGRGVLQLALGSAYNDLGDYQRAMADFDDANRVFKSLAPEPFSAAQLEGYTDDLIATFSEEFVGNNRALALDTDLPLFIVGMPRSGTTLTESIVSSHPFVSAGGEIAFWSSEAVKAVVLGEGKVDGVAARTAAQRYLQLLRGIGPDATRVTDKLPFNYLHVGLLHLLFPNARFLHCRRHPVDNCLSFYMTTFNHAPVYSHDKENIVFAYRQYARLMAHWRKVIPANRLLEVIYEDLVSDQEAVTRRLIEFCGLDWNEACLRPEQNERVISTMSHRQARQPVYTSSLERWRRYEPWLDAFQSLIDEPPTF